MLRSLKVRLYPDKDQKVMWGKNFGSCMFIWNYYLELRIKKRQDQRKSMSGSI
ncbi:MAG TPA: hypothetical protein ENO31_02090 [Thermoprotei archaeon]|nr:hypothetical protein [Thermoprotei archaeon]